MLRRLFHRPLQGDQPQDAVVGRVIRRKVVTNLLWRHLSVLRFAVPAVLYFVHALSLTRIILLLIGYVWMLALPLPELSQSTYIDENALQPAQVATYWNWGDVHRADRYLAELEALRDRNASSEERANYFMTEFAKLGISTSTQNYAFKTSTETISGTNAYAVISSPRTSGTEAILLSASWLSQSGPDDGALNLRGVSTILALSAFLKRYSHWSKDIIFVISDGYLDGMHAWLSAYHGSGQSNLEAEHLAHQSGVIWTALNIDYPGHSFSHLGVFREGLNGRLPNQDLINSFRVISHHTGGVPVLLYDQVEPSEFPGHQDIMHTIPQWVPKVVAERSDVIEYVYRAKNILRHVEYQARGRTSGVHGLLHQFRIDAITLYAVPSNGPHGFHALGRIVESTLRTMSNLLERLHASFFFYIMTTPGTFLKIGKYLPSAVLIGTALMFGGLGEWVNAGWTQVVEDDEGDEKEDADPEGPKVKWVRRRRDVLPVLGIMCATHGVGAILFTALSSTWFMKNQTTLTLPVIFFTALLPLAVLLFPTPDPSTRAPLPTLLKSLLLCFASTIVSITSVVNFSLAAFLAVLLGVPLSLAASTSSSLPVRLSAYSVYVALALGWLTVWEEVRQAVWHWEVLGVWFAPLICVVYVPLVLQAGIVSLLLPS